ncbi:hypothetical protein F4818DRAFT_123742 [Hypoxylon cercidicola]|nr:hypothetical protein F4818DRAFT_123742 [Hypoxylon cercidicola]
MLISRRAIATIAFARSSTLPASCYDTCNNAYLEAQHTGKTPALCASGSPFQTLTAACRSCSSVDDNDDALQSTLLPLFEPYIEYCEAQTASSSTSAASTTGTTSTTSSNSNGYIAVTVPLSRMSCILTCIAPLEINYVADTATLNGVATTELLTAVISYTPEFATTVFTDTSTLNGEPRAFVTTQVLTKLPSDFLDWLTGDTMSGTDVAPKPANTEFMQPMEPQSRSWIAGPIVGGLAGLLIVGIGALLLWRRRQKLAKGKTGFELHGDSAIKSEMEVPNHPRELEADNPLANDPGPHELPADGK